MTYLTPQLFRAMSTGADLTDLEDAELAFILQRARTLVDSYCAVPSLPIPHDFRGGTVLEEEHPWRIGTDVTSGAHRVYLWHRPLKTITELKIFATPQQYLSIDTDALFINQSGGYAEIASVNVTPFGLFGAAVLPIIGLQTPISKTSYSYGWDIPVVDEILRATDGLTYQAQHQWWTSDVVDVKVDGVSAGSYTVDRNEGTVTFPTAQSAESIITASYTHKLPGEIAQATAVIATALLGERELVAKGMNQLAAITVEEVSLRRSFSGRGGQVESSTNIPDEARSLLDGFVFRTVR